MKDNRPSNNMEKIDFERHIWAVLAAAVQKEKFPSMRNEQV